jgi:oxygen-independent coproporphyrinogen-3 oxidase
LFSAPAQVDDPFGVYVHIPFCAHVCPYCDFNTYAGQTSRIPAYVDAACQETAMWSPLFDGRRAATIFIGGGTPSLLEPGQIRRIIAACRSAFDVAPDAEVTIEANPNDLEEAFCHAVRHAGVTRLSIGAQTLNHRGLRVLGRLHDAKQIARAVAAARRSGFDNVSLDLIYGWPGQSLEMWREDLNRVLAGEVGGAAPEHFSLYELIVEPGTPMADAVARGILTSLDADAAADYSELAAEMLSAARWLHYEIANWSADRRFASRHNAIYWRNGDYAGIGAGAHGHVASRRTMNQPSPRRYITSVMEGQSPATNIETIGAETAMSETMMLGLRLLEDGVSATAFGSRHGVSLMDQFGSEVHRLLDCQMLERVADRVRLTPRGAALANSVCTEFLAS